MCVGSSLPAACRAENASVGPVECAEVDTHGLGGALPVAGTALDLAEGTAGIEPAGEAERATTTKPEALAPWTQGKAGSRPETLLQEGKHEPELLPLLPQGPKGGAGCVHETSLTERECRPEVLPQDGKRRSKASPKVALVRANVSLIGCQERQHEEARACLTKMLPQKRDCERAAPLRRDPNEGTLATWGLGEKKSGERIFESLE